MAERWWVTASKIFHPFTPLAWLLVVVVITSVSVVVFATEQHIPDSDFTDAPSAIYEGFVGTCLS